MRGATLLACTVLVLCLYVPFGHARIGMEIETNLKVALKRKDPATKAFEYTNVPKATDLLVVRVKKGDVTAQWNLEVDTNGDPAHNETRVSEIEFVTAPLATTDSLLLAVDSIATFSKYFETKLNVPSKLSSLHDKCKKVLSPKRKGPPFQHRLKKGEHKFRLKGSLAQIEQVFKKRGDLTLTITKKHAEVDADTVRYGINAIDDIVCNEGFKKSETKWQVVAEPQATAGFRLARVPVLFRVLADDKRVFACPMCPTMGEGIYKDVVSAGETAMRDLKAKFPELVPTKADEQKMEGFLDIVFAYLLGVHGFKALVQNNAKSIASALLSRTDFVHLYKQLGATMIGKIRADFAKKEKMDKPFAHWLIDASGLPRLENKVADGKDVYTRSLYGEYGTTIATEDGPLIVGGKHPSAKAWPDTLSRNHWITEFTKADHPVDMLSQQHTFGDKREYLHKSFKFMLTTDKMEPEDRLPGLAEGEWPIVMEMRKFDHYAVDQWPLLAQHIAELVNAINDDKYDVASIAAKFEKPLASVAGRELRPALPPVAVEVGVLRPEADLQKAHNDPVEDETEPEKDQLDELPPTGPEGALNPPN